MIHLKFYYSKKTFFLLLIFITSFLFSCNKQSSDNVETKFLGHRGSGCSLLQQGYMENTIPSIENAFKYFDGVEVDIQMSKSGTIWIYHDGIINACDTNSKFCIPNSIDSTLENITICHYAYKDRLYKLEELFELLESNQSKFVSLDVKGYYPNFCIPANNVSESYQKQFAKELIKLINNYGLENKILIETDYQYFLDCIKIQKPELNCYLLSYQNFNKALNVALQKTYDGISSNFQDTSLNKECILNAHKNKLKVQIWTPNNEEDLRRILLLKPDFIQTDNSDAKSFLNQ